MEALFGLFGLFAALFAAALPILLLVWLLTLTSRIKELRARIDHLEAERSHERAIERLARVPVAAPPAPEPIAEKPAPEPERPPTPAPRPPTPKPEVPPPPVLSPPPPPPRPIVPEVPPVTVAARAGWSTEEVIGGVWLQNVGSVLVLVAFFFLVLWGYTTGRIGPGGLVAAGVALGGLFFWRGDRVARSLPGFGHALVGIGLGVAYLSLYLGHFTLGVLTTFVAFGLLTATSLIAVIAGQHYRVQTIAALGVLGAFVPQIAATLAHLRGFEHQPPGLLAYLAFVNLAVFWLAARSSWSGLALTSTLLTAATWVVALNGRLWSWPVEAGLCALFVLLGLAPLKRWAEREEPAKLQDLALVTVAPYALVAASWPFFADASRTTTALFMASLTAIYAAAAWWIDGRRERPDFWRALITACVVFATTMVERALGETWTPMGWCVEAAVLIALGVRMRAGWLRALGYAVFTLGALTVIPSFLSGSAVTLATRLGDVFPLSALTADSIRCLVAIAAFAVTARALERDLDALSNEETHAPAVFRGVGHAFVMLWLAQHAMNVAVALPQLGPRWLIATGLAAVAWSVHATFLVWQGLRRDRTTRRVEGYVVLALSILPLAVALLETLSSESGALPFTRAATWFALAWVGIAFLVASLVGRARAKLTDDERLVPEFASALAHGGLAAWFGVEVTSFARWVGRSVAPVLGSSLTALLWALQSAWLIVRGIAKERLFQRAMGYVFGIVSALTLAAAFPMTSRISGEALPYVHAAALLEIAWIVLAFAMARQIALAEDRLGPAEDRVADVVTVTAHLALASYAGTESAHAARVLDGVHRELFGTSVTAALWMLQSAWLVLRGIATGRLMLRALGYVIGLCSSFALVISFGAAMRHGGGDPPFVGPYALLGLLWIALAFVVAHALGQRRERFEVSERLASEWLTGVAHAALLGWSWIETSSYAGQLGPERGAIVGPALASGAWLAQAAVAFAIGWMRDSSYLRWLGLGLFGVTVSKVTLFDLSRADTFVRAVIAVAVGTVLLVVSYVYQRARKNRSTAAASPSTLSEP